MGEEARVGILGRFGAALEDERIKNLPSEEKDWYVANFVNESINYSFQEVKRKNRGIRKDRELEGLEPSDMKNLIGSAKYFKENVNYFFNAVTVYTYMRAFLLFYQEKSFRPILDKM